MGEATGATEDERTGALAGVCREAGVAVVGIVAPGTNEPAGAGGTCTDWETQRTY